MWVDFCASSYRYCVCSRILWFFILCGAHGTISSLQVVSFPLHIVYGSGCVACSCVCTCALWLYFVAFLFRESEGAMRAVCLFILLVSLVVFSTDCQNVPSDSGAENPTLDEVLERAEDQLLRSFLQKQQDDESANGVHSIFTVSLTFFFCLSINWKPDEICSQKSITITHNISHV